MKRVIIKVTCDLLEDVLKLPKDIRIHVVYQDLDNTSTNTFKVGLFGKGLADKYETAEGAECMTVSREALE